MNYWAGLYNAELQGMLEDGVKVLLSYAYRALSQQEQARPLPQLTAPPDVRDGSDNDEEWLKMENIGWKKSEEFQLSFVSMSEKVCMHFCVAFPSF